METTISHSGAEAPGREVQERRVAGAVAPAEARLEEPGAPGEAEPGEERELAGVLGRDAQILAQTIAKGISLS